MSSKRKRKTATEVSIETQIQSDSVIAQPTLVTNTIQKKPKNSTSASTRSKKDKTSSELLATTNSSLPILDNNERSGNKLKFLQHRLLKIQSYFESFIDSAPSFFETKSRLASLELIYKEFLTLIEQISNNETFSNDSSIQNEMNNFEMLYHSTNAKCHNILTENRSIIRTLPDVQPTKANYTKKLPDIQIPKFDGNPKNWLTFKDTYIAVIHENNEIDDIVKFTYLLSKLELNARAAIGHITLSAAGYKKAWNLLVSRFDNKRVLVDVHLDALLNLPSMQKETFSDLRNLLNLIIAHTSSLEACDQKIEGLGELLLINITCKKIDPLLRKKWENELSINKLPEWDKLIQFLENQCRILESVDTNISNRVESSSANKFQNKYSSSKFTVRPKPNTSTYISTDSSLVKPVTFNETNLKYCQLCKKSEHPLYMCHVFLEMSVSDRYKKVRELSRCTNCLRYNHYVNNCFSRGCKLCSKKHHTLLHVQYDSDNTATKVSTEKSMESKVSSNPEVQVSYYTNETNSKFILLSTAIVLIKDERGKFHEVRALLDSASQSNFISSTFEKKFNFKTKITNVSIAGINEKNTNIAKKITSTIKSCCSKYKKEMEFLIVPKISSALPQHNFDISRWSIPPKLNLADPTFNVASAVDMLLGAEIFLDILYPNKLELKQNLPTLQETAFGWIFNGKYEEDNAQAFISLNQNIQDNDEDLNSLVKKFWETENLPLIKHISLEEQKCETHFVQTHDRETSGRYKVFLPLKDNIKNIGQSKSQAMTRFLSLEAKLNSNKDLKIQYVDFMKEYVTLNHMKMIIDNDNILSYYMPHHAVIKPSSSTTKLRVVFDASAKTTTNLSLNSCMLKGPNVQDDLFNIVLRFRKYTYVMTCDISKMYRQINVDNTQTNLQRILWRFSPDETVKTYELKTVTYGTVSAPYLATRVLNQLAADEKITYPLGSEVTKNDFYVDDCLTGANSLEEALEIQNQLINLLGKGGFKIHKWASNHDQLLKNISASNRENLNNENFCEGTIKTLGLIWKPNDDIFTFNIQNPDNEDVITKRTILSDTCKLFDPLGLIAPIIVTAKKLIQALWKTKKGWDEALSQDTVDKWNHFRNNLINVNNIKLERQALIQNAEIIELHGFADASQDAFGACIYIKSVNSQGETIVSLLCSKSRISPIKTTSIPRLELMAAHLLAQLMNKVESVLKIAINKIFLWSDSSIVLIWINTEPYKLKPFVANRIAQIQELTSNFTWMHVRSIDNPADIISRGTMPEELESLGLWWHGPQFLLNQDYISSTDITNNIQDCDILEYKAKMISLPLIDDPFSNWVNNFSSLNRLIRAMAYILRFIKNTKVKIDRSTGILSIDEIKLAMIKLIFIIQNNEFQSELSCLKKGKVIPHSSKLVSLSPFLDHENILRVGGRLKNSHLSYNCKHPIILPANNHFTNIVFRSEHIKNLHAGPQLLLSIVRQQFWPINGKSYAKQTVRKCVTCFKMKPIIIQQSMGQLPEERITPARPFSNTGVDFCGPFMLKNKRQRNSAMFKVYISVFVCFITKAVHLEVVSDLSSEAFLAALKRFIYRRGKPHTIWSDNGTNFVGTNNELKRLYSQFIDQNKENDLTQYCLIEQIHWKFIPPRSPNFGGLWEASVKSLKANLKRVTCNVVMSYEELNTLSIQIEGIMNSRPLYALPSDSTDSDPLTPAHFLIGAPITSIGEPYYLNTRDNCLSNWKKITKMMQSFWKRFSTEYLHSLQQRNKWKTTFPNIEVNDIVLILDENLPSHMWLMGRIVSVAKGVDGLVRVVEVKTRNGIYKRSISKITKLPI